MLCIRYPEMYAGERGQGAVPDLSQSAPASMKYQVMKNLYSYLQEVERTMQQANTERTITGYIQQYIMYLCILQEVNSLQRSRRV